MPKTKIRVLFFREGEHWVAQGLEYDIAAQGASLDDARYAFEHALYGQLVVAEENGIDPFEAIPRAPRVYWERFERASRVPLGGSVLGGQDEALPAHVIREILDETRIY